MKDFIIKYVSTGEDYWWAFIIIFLLVIIIAHIPNVKDFRYWDIKIPVILITVWIIFKLIIYFNLI